ncbi:MAG: prolyl oligopeptidase family serine peptidase [Clostridia bacterium]|nr:prolyl oligopeptidase family serine peptidase [Clostridia bacterium]MBO5416012.1 prolyl oligopeptidase family serine peptidase [Clostridia bacterium]
MKIKRIISLFMALLLALSTLCLLACDDSGEDDVQSSTNGESATEESSKDETTSEETTTEETTTEETTAEESSDEETTSEDFSSEESSSEETTSEESSSEKEEPEPEDPADIIDPNAPENTDLNIIASGSSEYIIVYDSDIDVFSEYAQLLSLYINEQFGVTLSVYSDEEAPAESTKRIVIGDADENAVFVKNKLYESNDFAVDVCGDDLILYAVSEYVYEYLFEVAKREFFTKDGEQVDVTVAKDAGFIYHKSDYTRYNYAQYLKLKMGKISYETLLELFEARTYTAEDGTVIPYRFYVPSSYDPENETTPLLVILHGAGERGNDNSRQLINLVPDIFSLNISPYADAIIICPQCPGGQQWVDTPWSNGNYNISHVPESNELGAVVELIYDVEDEYRPDTSRYYVMGLSMGGFGTWDLIMRHTELFAAAIPICGGADTTQAEKLKDFPIWTFHGTADYTVPYTGTYEMKKAFDAVGSKVFKFMPMANAGHTIWSTVGQNRGYGRWLFEQIKPEEN